MAAAISLELTKVSDLLLLLLLWWRRSAAVFKPSMSGTNIVSVCFPYCKVPQTSFSLQIRLAAALCLICVSPASSGCGSGVGQMQLCRCGSGRLVDFTAGSVSGSVQAGNTEGGF